MTGNNDGRHGAKIGELSGCPCSTVAQRLGKRTCGMEGRVDGNGRACGIALVQESTYNRDLARIKKTL